MTATPTHLDQFSGHYKFSNNVRLILLTAKQFADEDETGHDGHVTRRLLKTSSVGEVFVISAFGSVMTTSRLSLSRTPPVATAPSSTHPRDTESLAHRRPPACDPRHTSTRKLSGTTRLPTGRTRHKSSWSEIISWQRDTHAFHVQPELEDYAGDDTSYRHRTVLIAQLSSRNTVMSRCCAGAGGTPLTPAYRSVSLARSVGTQKLAHA